MTTGAQASRRHPDEATLLAYVSGCLPVAHRLVIACHAERCTHCRGLIRAAEWAGGRLLDDLPAVPVRTGALEQCLAQLHASKPSPDRPRGAAPQLLVGGVPLPSPLRRLKPAQLRWLAPGIWHGTLYRDDDGTLHLLRVRPDVALPEHLHAGLELTCVLQGSFHDGNGRYAEGDVSEAGEDPKEGRDGGHHLVVAEPPSDCVCLLATNGPLRFKHWALRLLQPLSPF